MPLGTETHIAIVRIGFLNIFRYFRFNSSKSYFSYVRSSEIAWDALWMDASFLLYYFSSGTVFDSPFAHLGSESRQMDVIGLPYTRN